MKLNPKSIRERIILSSLGLALILGLLVATISYLVFQNLLSINQLQSAQNGLQLMGSQINSDLNDIVLFSNWCSSSPEIRNYLDTVNSDQAETPTAKILAVNTWTTFSEEFNTVRSRTYLGRGIISSMDGSHFLHFQPISYSTGNAAAQLMHASFFDELTASDAPLWIGITDNPISQYLNPKIIPLLHTIQYHSNPIGWIYLEIRPEILIDRFANYQLAQDAALFVNLGNTVYRYSDGELLPEALPDNVRLVSYSVPSCNWIIYQQLSNQELLAQQQSYIMIILGIFLLILLLGLTMMFFMNRMITVPVHQLIGRLKRVGLGDFSRDTSIEWNNELGKIGKGINDLSENVLALMQKKVQDEKTKQELEYKILQSQINPHFLYNTLNSIKWMATIQGAEGIADMTTALSRLMKNVSKGSDSLIPLRNEIELLNDYFTIMKYRYGGSVELKYDITDEQLLECQIHRFTLQPIVENAIFHGIEPKGGPGCITIRIYEDRHDAQHYLMIDVTDNGIGIDEAAITQILYGNEESSNDFFKHLGVSNVNQRIRYSFGEEYGISAESKPGHYTTMRFTLPYLK